MNHLHYEFEASPGDIIEVTIDRAANVQLLDPGNYDNYINGRTYHYVGGYATSSPIRFAIDRPGLRHVVIDLGGGAGRVRATAGLISSVAR